MDKSTPNPKDRAEHILQSVKMIKKFVKGCTENAFLKDDQLQSAVLFQFLIIGEAIRYIDNNILDKYNYPWHIPRSFRNFIIHEYHEIKLERIYFATQDLEGLEKHMNLIFENEF